MVFTDTCTCVCVCVCVCVCDVVDDVLKFTEHIRAQLGLKKGDSAKVMLHGSFRALQGA